MTINEYDGKLPVAVEAEIIALCEACKMGENYDTACDLVYIWIKDEKIVGVIAFKRTFFDKGLNGLRIEHIFGTEAVRKTIQGPQFLIKVFSMVAKKGFNQVWCYVTSAKKYMYNYAIKFGFTQYANDNNGVFLVKNIG